jgi:hypothetical protein
MLREQFWLQRRRGWRELVAEIERRFAAMNAKQGARGACETEEGGEVVARQSPPGDADTRAERPLEAGCGWGDRGPAETPKPRQLAA